MKVIFQEVLKGNLPKKGEKEEFSVEKGEKHFYLYHMGNPSRDQLIAFNYQDANSEKVEARCEEIFEFFGYRFDKETKTWER